MDDASLRVLRAASEVLNHKRPEREQLAIIREFARLELPGHADLPADELATVVALKLMNIFDESILR